jgi:Protein of unknown function (DUF1616)
MSRLRQIHSVDLAVVCAVVAVGFALSLLAPGGWLQAIAVTPLVLAASGYAVAAALFPLGSIEREDRLVYSFAFCVTTTGLGGLLLQFVLDLDRAAWLALLVLLTLGATALALRRRSLRPTWEPHSRPVQLPRGALWALVTIAALGMAGASIAIATDGVHEQQSRQRFASLWALPAKGGVEVGVYNHGGPSRYRIEASSAGRPMESLDLPLASSQERQVLLGISPRTPGLLITLYSGSAPYRSVELNIEESR